MNLKFSKIVIALTLTISPIVAQAVPISITSLNTPYTQDFNTLANSSTSSTLPAGWALSETGSSADTTYAAGTGSSNVGNTYSFGAASSTERALGGVRSGSVNPTFGAEFMNDTGVSLTSLNISYQGEQWRLGATGRNDRLDFQYSLNATSLTTGTWIDINSLDFVAPVSTGTAGALDGNVNSLIVSSTISSLSIADDAVFWIRWTDFDATSSDDGLGIDNFSIVPEPATFALAGFGLVGLAAFARRRRA